MLLQSSISSSSLHHHNHHRQATALSSTLSVPQTSICRSEISFRRGQVTCSISQAHTYGTTDYERRPVQKWNVAYRKISVMENSTEATAADVLSQAEKEGKKFTKWELCKIVKELRKYRRFRQALEVYEWMNNRGERYRLAASDAAIQLDLISKVRGIPSAEEYFQKLPDTIKDNRIYGSLLNAYTQTKNKKKAEALMDDMRKRGYTSHPLPFNVMMTLYMNLKEFDKVEAIVTEMDQKNLQLDIYSYNIWLSSCGSQGSMEKMEKVFARMKMDQTIILNWTTYSTMATMYTRQGQIEKAEECLRLVEGKIAGRDRIPYHYLISLYGSVGNREELFRIWNIYRATFPTIPNMGYHAMVSSLVRIDDIKGAEEMYQQWLQVRATYDPRLPNLLMNWYVRKGQLKTALGYLDQMTEAGGKPNSNTWEILAEGYIGQRKVSEALSCFKDAFNAEGARNWRPKPALLAAFINLCDEEADADNKEGLVGLLRENGRLENEVYKSVIGLYDGPLTQDISEKEEDVEPTESYFNDLDLQPTTL